MVFSQWVLKWIQPLQVLYYSTSLFTAAGLEEWQSKYATLGVGSVMVIMTLVSIPLMDRAGRRTLHLYGLGGMFVFSLFITISLLIKVSVRDCLFNKFNKRGRFYMCMYTCSYMFRLTSKRCYILMSTNLKV